MLALLFLTGLAATDETARSDADLGYVPSDAQLFFSVRLADALATEQIQKTLGHLAKIAEQTGPNPLNQLKIIEEKIGLKLTDVERVTVVAGDLSRKEFWVVIRTTKDIPEDRVLSVMVKPEEKTAHGKKYHWQKKEDLGFHLAGPRLAFVATERGMKRCLALTGNDTPRGPLAGPLKLAAGDRFHVVFGADIWNALPVEVHETLTEAARGDGPEAAAADMLLKTRTISYTARYGKKLEFELSAEFRSADAARRAVPVLQGLLAAARKELKRTVKEVPEMAPIEAVLDQIKPVQDGAMVSAKVVVDEEIVMTALFAGVQNVRAAAALAITKDNYHNVGMALANYESAYGNFPAPATRDKNGKPLFSWRVEILPFIEEQALYNEFKRDEPWDGPNNIKLLDRMPKVFDTPYLPPAKAGHTHLQVCTGPKTMFPNDKNVRKGMTYAQLSAMDGASDTIMLAPGAKAVPWTAPDDIVIDKEAIKPKLLFGRRGAVIVLADVSVRVLPPAITEKTLRWAIDPNDGNVLGDDWNEVIRRQKRGDDR